MLNVLKFIFQDFWHFAGFAFLLMLCAIWRPHLINIEVDRSIHNHLTKPGDKPM